MFVSIIKQSCENLNFSKIIEISQKIFFEIQFCFFFNFKNCEKAKIPENIFLMFFKQNSLNENKNINNSIFQVFSHNFFFKNSKIERNSFLRNRENFFSEKKSFYFSCEAGKNNFFQIKVSNLWCFRFLKIYTCLFFPFSFKKTNYSRKKKFALVHSKNSSFLLLQSRTKLTTNSDTAFFQTKKPMEKKEKSFTFSKSKFNILIYILD